MSASDPPVSAPFVEQIPARCAVILNPRSGNGRAARQWRRLEPEVRRVLPQFDVFPTERPGHGTELTRRALHDGYDRIISAGGDGTHYEVINGFFEGLSPIRAEASFALLPIGTASDLRKTFALPPLPGAIELLASPRVLPADVGRLWSASESGEETLHYFNTAVHMGLGSLVNEHVNRRSKALGPFLTFVLGVISARLAYKPLEMTVTADGEPFTDRVLEVIVANGFYDGGGMHVAPRGQLNSGVFEVYIIGALNAFDSLVNVPRMYRGTQDRHPAVRYLRAKSVSVTCEAPVYAGPDGELAGQLPARMEVAPGAVRVVTGPNPRVVEEAPATSSSAE